jgi:hypothetical protein
VLDGRRHILAPVHGANRWRRRGRAHRTVPAMSTLPACHWPSVPAPRRAVTLPIGHGTHGDFCFLFSSPVYYLFLCSFLFKGHDMGVLTRRTLRQWEFVIFRRHVDHHTQINK